MYNPYRKGKKDKKRTNNATWQISVDKANDLLKSLPGALLYPSRNLQKSQFPCLESRQLTIE